MKLAVRGPSTPLLTFVLALTLALTTGRAAAAYHCAMTGSIGPSCCCPTSKSEPAPSSVKRDLKSCCELLEATNADLAPAAFEGSTIELGAAVVSGAAIGFDVPRTSDHVSRFRKSRAPPRALAPLYLLHRSILR